MGRCFPTTVDILGSPLGLLGVRVPTVGGRAALIVGMATTTDTPTTSFTSSVPSGWYYEPADPEVGIATGCWFHEDCPVGTSGDPGYAQGETIVCGDCGEVLVLDLPEPVCDCW